MINDFSGRPGAALVTGATGGIGRAIARMLAARGRAVALPYRPNAPPPAALVAELPRGAARSPHLSDPAAN
ncbi:MAG: dehydrogenase, partial [Actinobacteria bacterium]